MEIQIELKDLVSERDIPNLSIIDEVPPSVENSEWDESSTEEEHHAEKWVFYITVIILVFLVLNFGFGWSYYDQSENKKIVENILNTTNSQEVNSTINIEDTEEETIEVKIEIPQKLQNNSTSNSTDFQPQNTTEESSGQIQEHQNSEVIVG